MIPQSEQDVFYLFARNHEKLGFEKVLKTQIYPPDVYALKDGKEVGIELELHLLSAKNHLTIYKTWDSTVDVYEEEHKIHVTSKNSWDKYDYIIFDNVENNAYIERFERTKYVKLHNLKNIFDYIICWDAPKQTNWNPEIPVIILSKVMNLN